MAWSSEKEGDLYFAEKYADPALAAMRNVAGEIKGAQMAMRYAVDSGYQKLAIYYMTMRNRKMVYWE